MRNGFRVLDTDAHQMEPPAIWTEYMDPAFRHRAPRLGNVGGGRAGMCVEGEPIIKQDGNYVAFNTDYPHPDGTWPTGLADLERQPLPESSIRKIFWHNAAPLFGLA